MPKVPPAATILDFDSGRWSRVHKPRRAPATIRRWENGRREFGRRFVMLGNAVTPPAAKYMVEQVCGAMKGAA